MVPSSLKSRVQHVTIALSVAVGLVLTAVPAAAEDADGDGVADLAR